MDSRPNLEIIIELKKWRLIETGLSSAEWNMAVDEALLDNFSDDDLPILRIYRWKPSISLGRFSKVKDNLNLKIIKEKNLSIVRRMSGGGILIHGDDISYGLILSRNSIKTRGIKDNYRYLCKFLITLYKKLGHNVLFADEIHIESKKSAICLAGIEDYDIIIDGKKIGGNAQRYTKNALLQHGSIPIRVDDTQLETLIFETSWLNTISSLEKLGTLLKYEKLIELIKEVFSETFNVNFTSDKLSIQEEESVKKLMDKKYTQESWNIYANTNYA